MENKKQSAEEFGRSSLGKFFFGGLPILGGVLAILVSLSIIPMLDRAILNKNSLIRDGDGYFFLINWE